jgi:hypothetical protein
MSDDVLVRNARIAFLIRFCVLGGLAALLVLWTIDFQAKHAADSTAQAWRVAREHSLDEQHADLIRPQLVDFIRGQPRRSVAIPNAEKQEELKVVTGMEVYVWHGLLRDYVVEVYLGPGKVPSVEAVIGPAQAVKR